MHAHAKKKKLRLLFTKRHCVSCYLPFDFCLATTEQNYEKNVQNCEETNESKLHLPPQIIKKN